MVRSIVCLEEKKQLITGSWDHSIRIWALPKRLTAGVQKAQEEAQEEAQEGAVRGRHEGQGRGKGGEWDGHKLL